MTTPFVIWHIRVCVHIYITPLPKERLSLRRVSTFSHHQFDIYYTEFHENRRMWKVTAEIQLRLYVKYDRHWAYFHEIHTCFTQFSTEFVFRIWRKSENKCEKWEQKFIYTRMWNMAVNGPIFMGLTCLISFCTEFVYQISRKSGNKCEERRQKFIFAPLWSMINTEPIFMTFAG